MPSPCRRWQGLRTRSWHGYRGNSISHTVHCKANRDQQHVKRWLVVGMSSNPEILVLELLCRHTDIQMEIQLPRAILCAAETHLMHLSPIPRASAYSRAVDRCNRGWRHGTAFETTCHPPRGLTDLKECTLEISRRSERSGELSVAEDGSEGLEVGHPVPAANPAWVEPVRGQTLKWEETHMGSKCLLRAQEVQDKSNEASLGNLAHRCHRTDGWHLLSAN